MAVRGEGKDGMVNESELLINVVTYNKPKGLTGLNQKGKGVGDEVYPILIRRQRYSPANRQDLTRPHVTYAEHGKPVSPPKTPGKADRKEGP